MALFAGLRRQEIIELKWSDIDLFRGLINLRPEITKTKKQRFVPIPDFLEDHFSITIRDGEWVLMDGGEKILRDKFRFNWERFVLLLPQTLLLDYHPRRKLQLFVKIVSPDRGVF